ncbi:MAG: hypothetical protein JNK53_04955, partial [Phycisphaerae bacterium]|nr:hypothetical protein [Phycisphaerae bacterium]
MWTCALLGTGALFIAVAPAEAAPQGAPGVPLTAWVPSEEFSFPLGAPEEVGLGSRFGFSMAMNDTYAVIGAPDARLYDADSESQVNGAGAAYVFKRSGSTWTFVQRLVAPTIVLAQMGHSVAIDNTTGDIVIGAWAFNGRGFFSGAAFYFQKGSGDSWGVAETSGALGANTRMPTQNLVPTDLAPIDQFGFS